MTDINPETPDVETDVEETDEDVSTETVDLSSIDPGALAIAPLLVTQRQGYIDDRDLFIEDRDAKKAGTQSTKAVMARMLPHAAKMEQAAKDRFEELLAGFIADVHNELGEDSPGVLHLLWSTMNKGGDLHDYVVNRATDIITSGPVSDDPVPTIDQLASKRTACVGLFDAVSAMVGKDRAILKALGVPTKFATKGRADGSKLTLDVPELPKETKRNATSVTVVYSDEEEIYVSGDGRFASIPAAVRSVIGTENWKAFTAAFETKGQTLSSLSIEFQGHFIRSEIRSVNVDEHGHTKS